MGERDRRWPTGIGMTLGIGMLLLSACALKPGSGQQAVRVGMDEWTVKPSVSTVSPGLVRFEVVNQGREEHELIVLKTDLPPTSLKMRANEDKVDEDASGQNIGEIEDVEASKTKTGTFDLPAGRYVLLCNVAAHYRQGMATPFEVKP